MYQIQYFLLVGWINELGDKDDEDKRYLCFIFWAKFAFAV